MEPLGGEVDDKRENSNEESKEAWLQAYAQYLEEVCVAASYKIPKINLLFSPLSLPLLLF